MQNRDLIVTNPIEEKKETEIAAMDLPLDEPQQEYSEQVAG